MNVTVEKQENCKALVTVVVPAADLKKARQTLVSNYAKTASFPGFRPGKVPASVVEKRIGASADSQARKDAIENSFGLAANQEKLNVVAVNKVEPTDLENGDLQIVYHTDTAPDVKLPLYKGLKLTVQEKLVSDETVEEFLQETRRRFADYKEVERGAQMKDYINIDYTGTFEGKPLKDVLEEGNHYLAENKNYPAEMADASFVDGFCEKLLGAKAGDELTITVTMPEDAGVVAGKEVSYIVKVNKLSEPILPDLDDALAAKLGGEGKTLADIREIVRRNQEYNSKLTLEQQKRIVAVEALRNVVEMDLPEYSVVQATNKRANELVSANMKQGLDIGAIQTHRDEILEAARLQATLDVKDEFILNEIARIEGLTVSQSELARRIDAIANENRIPFKKIVKDMQKDDSIRLMQYQMALEKAVSLIVANADYTIEQV